MQNSNGLIVMPLLKLGRKEHMEQFRAGLLYMNTLSYFRDLESDSARGDVFEGVDSIIQPKDLGESYFDRGISAVGRIDISPEDLAGPIRISMNRTVNCNLFCMHAITKPVNGPLFPAVHDWFGDSVTLVWNTPEFFKRVCRSAKERNFKMQRALTTRTVIPAESEDSVSVPASRINANIG